MSHIQAYFDGCCEPRNPGGAMGEGAIVYVEGKAVQMYSKFHPKADENTNNVAEYLAFEAVVDFLMNFARPGDMVEILGDSKLVIEQMGERWRIKKGLYYKYAKRSLQKYLDLKIKVTCKLVWISSERNNKADEMSRAELILRQIPFRRSRYKLDQ